MKRTLGIVVASAVLALGAGAAQAQSTPTTCDMLFTDLIVSVNGQATTVESGPGGVLVNGSFCGWPDELASVQVTGGALDDGVTFRGSFIPGDDGEPFFDELEVTVNLGGGTDTVTLELSGGKDEVVFSSAPANALRLNGDADTDFQLAGDVEVFELMGMGGDDIILGETSTIPTLYLYGGDGDDTIVGSDTGNDIIEGDAGNDRLFGVGGGDLMDGGPGNDVFNGGPGNDTVDYTGRTSALTVTIGSDPGANDGEVGEQDDVQADVENVWGGEGNDVLIGNELGNGLSGGGGADRLDGRGASDFLVGGPGLDTVDYSSRTGNLLATIGNGMQDDGEVGEFDEIEATVENVTGGAGNDTIVGTSARNTLRGGGGNDNLTGEGGNDTLYGDPGDDSLLGGAGADKLYGAAGSDVLDGGGGADVYTAGGGNDFLYNDDGVAETVNCGAGTDDAEVDTGATDTFIGCEL